MTKSGEEIPSVERVAQQDKAIAPGVLAICGVVILAAAATVFYLATRERPLDRATYNVVIALTCFMASSVSGLLFATRASISGTLGVIGLTVGGPGALWLAALLLMANVLQFGLDERSATTIARETLIEHEKHDGWIRFEDWLTTLGSLGNTLRKDEEMNLRQFLSSAYIRGERHNRLTRPIIDVLFMYPETSPSACPNASIKLQRIRGGHGGGEASVFVGSSPTNSANGVTSLVLDRSDSGAVTAHMPSAPLTWYDAPAGSVDLLFLTEYCDDIIDDGDWLQLHVPKYLVDGQVGTVNIGVASERPIKQTSLQLWQVQGAAIVGETKEFPVVLRDTKTAATNNIDVLAASLTEWIPRVEAAAETRSVPKEAMPALTRILPLIKRLKNGKPTFTTFPYRGSFGDSAAQRSVVLTFRWDRGVERLSRRS